MEAVSHSAFWADTAFFIVEDDAQDGADHEAHEYHRRGNEVSVKKVVDTLYNKASLPAVAAWA